MKGRILWMGPLLVTLLAMACFRPTEPTEPPFRTEPCPALPSKVSETTQAQAQALETLPIIPADTQGGIADFIVRVGHLRLPINPPAVSVQGSSSNGNSGTSYHRSLRGLGPRSQQNGGGGGR
jgi:hypothetical protein